MAFACNVNENLFSSLLQFESSLDVITGSWSEQGLQPQLCAVADKVTWPLLSSPQALLQAAEPDDPQDAVVARQYKEEPNIYQRTAKHWAQVYAGGEWGIHV